MGRQPPLGRILVLIALGVASAACGMDPDGSAMQAGARSWAPLPEEATMPAAAPDDPTAYRGVRYRPVTAEAMWWVESDGQEVPWLSLWHNGWGHPADWHAAERGVPDFGYQLVLDGRDRLMMWFYRQVEPPLTLAPPLPPAPPNPPPSPPESTVQTGPPPMAPTLRTTPTPPAPQAVEPARTASPTAPPPSGRMGPAEVRAYLKNHSRALPERAVLDVVVLSNEPGEDRWEMGCGVDQVMIDGDNGRLLNRTTGRIEPVDPAAYACPDYDD